MSGLNYCRGIEIKTANALIVESKTGTWRSEAADNTVADFMRVASWPASASNTIAK